MTLDASDIKRLTRKSKSVIESGDLYLNGFSVYRVMVYNVDQDSVLLGTTNDKMYSRGWTLREDLRKQGYYLCPLALREPAVQIFELDTDLSESSIKALNNYRVSNIGDYKRLNFDQIFVDMNVVTHRFHNVPEEQSAKYSFMAGKEYRLPVPFYCVGRAQIKRMIHDKNKDLIKKVLTKYTKWPIIYIPKFYETY